MVTRSQQLGDVGEDLASAWASQAGITVNRAQRERHGWDHFLEFSVPRANAGRDPLGVTDVTLSAKSQIKATCRSDRSISIKLSNWRAAVTDVLPWFFVVIRFERSSREPVEVAFIHVGEDFVERALSRIYRLSETQQSELHKHTMRLSWSEADLIEPPYADSLLKAIERAVGDDPFRYSQAKHGWREMAGLVDPSWQASIQVSAESEDELYRRLARAAVGLDESLEVSRVSFTRTRFGRREVETRLPTEGLLSFEPPGPEQEVTLIVSRQNGSEAVALRTPLRFSAAVFPTLPEKYWLLRFQPPLLDLLLDMGSDSLNVQVNLADPQTKMPLEHLRDALRLLRLFGEATGGSLLFHLGNDDVVRSLGSLVPTVDLNPDLRRLVRSGCALADLAEAVGAGSEGRFSIHDLYVLGPVAELMATAHHGRPLSVRIDFETRAGDLEPDRLITVITRPQLRFGSVVSARILAFSGFPVMCTRASGEVYYRLESSKPRLVRDFRLSVAQASAFAWDEEMAKAVEVLEAEGLDKVVEISWDAMVKK